MIRVNTKNNLGEHYDNVNGIVIQKRKYVTERLDIILIYLHEMGFYSSNKVDMSSGERVCLSASFNMSGQEKNDEDEL